MLHFEGQRDLSQAPAKALARLGDARFLAGSIPGVESVKAAEPAWAVCTVRPGLSFVRGTMEVTLRVIETTASEVRLGLQSKGVGSSSEVEIRIGLEAAAGGSRMQWTADVTSLGGLLRALPQGLIRGAADKVIKDVLDHVTNRLGEEPGPS